MKRFLRSRLHVFLILALAGLAIYAPVLGYPFVHDDVVFIQQNPDIGRWDNIAGVFLRPSFPVDAPGVQVPYYRPLLEVFYRLGFSVFGMNPAGFHLFNIILHIFNAWFVFLLMLVIRMPRVWGFVLSMIFLCHPVQSEAVSCISGVSNLLAAFFSLSAVLGYFRALRSSGTLRTAWSWGVIAIFVLALLTKEQTAVIPGIILVYELIYHRGSWQPFSRWLCLAGLFWILAGYFLWRQMGMGSIMDGLWENRTELVLRLQSIPQMMLNYWAMILSPTDLHYYRNLDILLPKLVPLLWFAGCALLGTAVSCVLPSRLSRWARLGALWFLIMLLPVLNIIPLINEYSFVLTAEHFLYLPLAGFLMFLFSVLGWARRTWHGMIPSRLYWVIIGGVLVICSVMTIRQNTFWRGEIPLFERTVSFEPGFGRGHLLLARAYAGAGRYDEALGAYERGLRIMEDYVKKAGSSKAGNVYGRYVQEARWGRGECYRMLGRLQEANHEYVLALGAGVGKTADIRRKMGQIADHLALNFIRLEDRAAAKKFFRLALGFDPRRVEAMNNLGMVALEEGCPKMAVFWFERALKVNPAFRPAWENLKRVQNF